MIGDTLLHYRITERLGSGGMGEVYRARDTKLNRDVALKILPADVAENPERRRRFEREAQAVAALQHPNIVTLHSVEMAGDIPFLTMELVEGHTLSELIPETGLSLDRFFEYAVPLVDAVASAHAKGITHRDLKPANVMVDGGGRIKVLDFGLAKLFEPATEVGDATVAVDPSATAEGKILGTAAYMSPEQAEGKPVDQRSDIFSLGIILYEMATGQRPFQGDTSLSVLSSILKDTPAPVTRFKHLFPRPLDRIIQHCLAKEPDRRFQSAQDIRNELEALRKEIDSGELETRPASGGRFPVARVGMGIGAVVVLVAAVLLGPRLLGPKSGDGAAKPGAGDRAIGVIGFENLSDPGDPEHLGRMLMGLITTDLVESGGLQVVTTPQILSALRQAGGDAQGTFDAAVAGEAAALAGADIMLVGQILQQGDRLLLTAELAEVKTGNTLGSLKKEANSEADLFSLAAGIAEEVRSRLQVEETPTETREVDLAGMLTDSPDAYRYYSLGELALQRQEWLEAVDMFDRALREDPTFAMGYYRKAMATWWVTSTEGAAEILQEGEPYLGRLPRHWQTLYRGVQRYLEGNDEEAFGMLTRLVDTGPGIPDAYYVLGEICTHSPRYGDLAKALEYFERTLELDPTFTLVLYHLIEQYIQAEDLAAAERALARCRIEAPDDPVLKQSELSLLNARGEYEEAIARGERLRAEGYTAGEEALLTSLTCAGEKDKALALAADLARARDSRMRGLAEVQATFGQFRAALESYRIAPWDVAQNVSAGWTQVCGIRLLLGDPEGALAAADSAVAVAGQFFRAHAARAEALHRLGRETEVDAVQADVERLSTELGLPAGPYWVEFLRARVHLWRGELPEAERAFEAASAHPSVLQRHVEMWTVQGQLLEAQGDAAGAARAYARAQIARGSPYWLDPVMAVRGLFLQARAEEAAGDPAAARETYREFLRYWGEADSPVSEVEEAKARLAALEAGR